MFVKSINDSSPLLPIENRNSNQHCPNNCLKTATKLAINMKIAFWIGCISGFANEICTTLLEENHYYDPKNLALVSLIGGGLGIGSCILYSGGYELVTHLPNYNVKSENKSNCATKVFAMCKNTVSFLFSGLGRWHSRHGKDLLIKASPILIRLTPNLAEGILAATFSDDLRFLKMEPVENQLIDVGVGTAIGIAAFSIKEGILKTPCLKQLESNDG